jgi:hypothetical protein
MGVNIQIFLTFKKNIIDKINDICKLTKIQKNKN